MKPIVWIDIGTHEGQEFRSVFGPALTAFGIRAFRRFIGAKWLGRGKSPSASQLWKLFVTRSEIRKNRNLFYAVVVDANANLLKHWVYQEADAVFCVALANTTGRGVSVGKLYLVHNDLRGHGSSVFEEKHNINEETFLPSLIIHTDVFAKELACYLASVLGDYKVLLRVNCEGSEDDVVYSFHRVFSTKLMHVFGSLKDVHGVKGENAYRELMQYLQCENIGFTAFSSDLNSWVGAHERISTLLKQCLHV